MQTFQIREAEFSPAEAELITGADVDSLRNWRRRGFLRALPDGKHARFKTDELGYLMALKAFSDAGVSIDRARNAASAATLPVYALIGVLLADKLKSTEMASMVGIGPNMNYVVMTDGLFPIRTDNLATLDKSPSLVKIVFDCATAAVLIIKRAPRPLLTFEVGVATSKNESSDDKPRNVPPAPGLRGKVRRKK